MKPADQSAFHSTNNKVAICSGATLSTPVASLTASKVTLITNIYIMHHYSFGTTKVDQNPPRSNISYLTMMYSVIRF